MEFIDLGLTPYKEALEYQQRLLLKVIQGDKDKIIFCSHPPVVTLGRAFKTKNQDPITWTGEVVETVRGGKSTYHGPNQIIIYPILNLTHQRVQCRPKDIHDYIRKLEMSVIKTLTHYKITAQTLETPPQSPQQFTGVWVENKKIASIGIAVKKWVTYHGCALNLYEDEKAFEGIQPCGFQKDTMTSVEQVLNRKIDRQLFIKDFQNEFKRIFSPL